MKKFPTAFTILFVLIVVVAALTWIIPAGQYERAMNETLGREAPVPGTYAQVEPNPQGLVAVLMAPIAGLYDPATGMANAVDVAVFVLIIGGFLAVVTKTGAIDAGIGWLLTALKGREIWMIPILMAAFAAGGTSYGMAEESLAFYAIVLPVFIRAGYDALTGVAVDHARLRHRHARLDLQRLRDGRSPRTRRGCRSPTGCCCGSSSSSPASPPASSS